MSVDAICTQFLRKKGNVYVIVWHRIFHGDIFGNDLHEFYESIRIKRHYSRKVI